jgi:hypothetical protein
MGECVPWISAICISAQNSLVAKDFHRFYQPYFSSIICQSRKYPQKVLRFAAVQSSVLVFKLSRSLKIQPADAQRWLSLLDFESVAGPTPNPNLLPPQMCMS